MVRLRPLLKAVWRYLPVVAAVVILTINATSGPASAAEEPKGQYYIDGDTLTNWCRNFLLVRRQGDRGTPEQGATGNLCRGFVLGVVDALSIQRIVAYCVPGDPIDLSLVEIVANYVDRHPELRTESGFTLTWKALAEAYPCTR